MPLPRALKDSNINHDKLKLIAEYEDTDKKYD